MEPTSIHVRDDGRRGRLGRRGRALALLLLAALLSGLGAWRLLRQGGGGSARAPKPPPPLDMPAGDRSLDPAQGASGLGLVKDDRTGKVDPTAPAALEQARLVARLNAAFGVAGAEEDEDLELDEEEAAGQEKPGAKRPLAAEPPGLLAPGRAPFGSGVAGRPSPGGESRAFLSDEEGNRLTRQLGTGQDLIAACRSARLVRQCLEAGKNCVRRSECRPVLARQLAIASETAQASASAQEANPSVTSPGAAGSAETPSRLPRLAVIPSVGKAVEVGAANGSRRSSPSGSGSGVGPAGPPKSAEPPPTEAGGVEPEGQDTGEECRLIRDHSGQISQPCFRYEPRAARPRGMVQGGGGTGKTPGACDAACLMQIFGMLSAKGQKGQ